MEIHIDDQKLRLHGLQQYFCTCALLRFATAGGWVFVWVSLVCVCVCVCVCARVCTCAIFYFPLPPWVHAAAGKLKPEEKNRKLTDLLDSLEFNQVIIFVSKVNRAEELNRLLQECSFPSTTVHAGIKDQAERCVGPACFPFVGLPAPHTHACTCASFQRMDGCSQQLVSVGLQRRGCSGVSERPSFPPPPSSSSIHPRLWQHQAVQGLQGVQQPHPCDHGPVWPRHRH
jgi:hypothetical protein